MSPKFEYSPLTEDDGIRIFRLLPANSRTEALRGSLQHISLAQQYDDLIEPYTALSYVWGDPTPVDRILLDDHELGITANLGAALRDLRDVRRIHRLWVDAICIDQDNIPERSSQVARMGEIYSRANNTIIYLGPLNPYVEAIIELERQHCHLSPSSDNLAINPPVLCGSTEDEISLVGAAYKGLLFNPWFQRTWVLQELVLSRVPWVQCGLKRVRWQDLCHLLIPHLKVRRHEWEHEEHEKHEKHKITALETMHNIRTEYYSLSDGERRTQRTLLQVLQSRKGCKVSDPRDFIFAHMAIISDRHIAEKFIRVDYSQTTSDVFAAVACYVLYNKDIDYMLLISRPSPFRTMFSLPSWVPDWGVDVNPRHFCWETQTLVPALSRRRFHVLSLLMFWAEKIIALSGILPAPSAFRHSRYSVRSWNDWIDLLPAATKDNTWLIVWPHEAAGRELPQYNEEEERKDYRAGIVDCLDFYCSLGDERVKLGRRLALLNNGLVIITPGEALPGDIVAELRDKDRLLGDAVVVRPCESCNPTDLEDALKYMKEYRGVKLEEDCSFQDASFIGFCEGKLLNRLGWLYIRSTQDKKPSVPILLLH
ncbi:heterokaryon incompatibility protein-domain-containing protein [Xylaria telfairii]|nr:heterokaryon incompatibility protein-domain-containing protein [Xylaria telfairii]